MTHQLDQRRSVPAKQLDAPGPDQATVLRMLQSAVRVPDHGKRVPFRFVRIAGPMRATLSERIAARSLERDPDVGEGALEKDRNDAKIPRQERLLTAGCVCFALLQAAQAEGFGAQWLTGWPAYDASVRALLGLGEQECIAGFIHVGTPKLEAPERDRPDPAALLTDLAL